MVDQNKLDNLVFKAFLLENSNDVKLLKTLFGKNFNIESELEKLNQMQEENYRQLLIAEINAINDSASLHYLFNAQEELSDLLSETIALHPNCDIATATQIFWSLNPLICYNVKGGVENYPVGIDFSDNASLLFKMQTKANTTGYKNDLDLELDEAFIEEEKEYDYTKEPYNHIPEIFKPKS